jgi:hypothetical protein
MAPPSPVDTVVALLKNAKGPGDVLGALSHDPLLLTGIVAILALIYLFGRVYIWPTINPFQVQWIANLWGWLIKPRPLTPQERYPYAKVTYTT